MKTMELEYLFFEELKNFNGSNFKTLLTSDVTKNDAKIRKCYSSVITRYFIFREKHSELSEGDLNSLYYKLKLDLIAQYFADYPDSDVNTLVAFQNELKKYVEAKQKQNSEASKSEEVATDDEQQTAKV